ncbi:hypothetical protein SBA3_910011 [Candidatus Sulfopaludibacter sp. SbA3]|nr:hypothetical protein SBA3_910011 [Candidatus Sulfopaludibacter sp. SbA3]
MNLCEYRDTLDNLTLSKAATDSAFQNLTKPLASAVHANGLALSWYSRATFSALAAIVSAKAANLKVSDPGSPWAISLNRVSGEAFLRWWQSE